LLRNRDDPLVEAGVRRDQFAEARKPILGRRLAERCDSRVEVAGSIALAAEISACDAGVAGAVLAVTPPEFC
jgi:hypothetical protein